MFLFIYEWPIRGVPANEFNHYNINIVVQICTETHTGSEDIVTPNLKLILGLVWTLILHYQISQGFRCDIDDPATDTVEGPSAAQALLAYMKVCVLYMNWSVSPS